MAYKFYCSDSPSIDRILSPRYEILERSIHLNENKVYLQLYDYSHKLSIMWYFYKTVVNGDVVYHFDPYASSWYEDTEVRCIRNQVIEYLNCLLRG